MERAAQVHVEDGLEVVVGHLLQRCATDVSGVVDEDVDAAVVLQRRVDDRLAAAGVATESVLATASPPAAVISRTTSSAGAASAPSPADCRRDR